MKHSSPSVRDVLLRLAPPHRSGGVLAAVITDLHARLTGGG